ncbi:MAG TPA: hypothetical protein VK567_19650 [Bradyrhizobium sp.]|nr:hypothetical protein [Bradyrhizobium sp.]
MEPLLVRAKTCDPVLHLGSHLAGDVWSRGGNIEWDIGRRLLDDFDRFDWFDRVNPLGRLNRLDRVNWRCLNARLCPPTGVQSPGAELPVVD